MSFAVRCDDATGKKKKKERENTQANADCCQLKQSLDIGQPLTSG